MLQALEAPVLAIEVDGRIAFANGAARRLFGAPPGRLDGEPIAAFLPTDSLPDCRRLHELNGERRPVNVRTVQGDRLELELSFGTLLLEDGELLLASFFERAELDRQIAIARYMRTAARAAALVSARLDLGYVLETLVNVLVQDLSVATARVWLLEESGRLCLGAAAGGPCPPEAFGEQLEISEASPVGRVALSRLPLVRSDLSSEPGFPPQWLASQRIGSAAILPLTLGRELHGVLACFLHAPPDDELIEVLFAFASMAAASVNDIRLLQREQNARAEAEAAQRRLALEREEAERRARELAEANRALSAQHRELELARCRLSAQYAVLQALAESATLADAAPRILEAIGTSMGWDFGTLWLPDARGSSLKPAETWESPAIQPPDLAARARRVSYAVGEGIVGRVFQTGEPAWTEDEACSHFRRAEVAAEVGLHGGVWFPVRRGSEVLGVVELYRRERGAPDDETLLAVTALGRQIGQFIERIRVQRALRESEERLGTTLRSIGEAVVATDARGRVELINAVGESITGWLSEEARGRPLDEVAWFIDPAASRPQAEPSADPAAGLAAQDEALLVTRRGKTLVEKIAGPILSPAGEPLGTVLVFRDVTEKRRAEARRQLVSEASALLAASHDYDETLRSVAAMAVPAVADWCAIELIDGEGPRLVTVAHLDPDRAERARRLRESSRRDPIAESLVGRVLDQGEALLFPELEGRLVAGRVWHRDATPLLRELAPSSMVLAPLTARGRNQGVIVLGYSGSGRRYDKSDLAMAEELGRRIGLALDNSRLFLQAQEAVRARDEFLSIASHELKTPLTSLRLHLQGLARETERGDLERERALSKLGAADKQAARLAELIEELLDVSNLTAGRLRLDPEPVDLTILARDVAGHFAGTLARSGCTLELWAPAPVRGRWDRSRLEQLVTNLLSNAIKYGPGKPIRLRLEKDARFAYLSVADQGIGIHPDDLERIFARFERAVSSRNYGGLGIGLFIVRRVLDAMGGKISVVSRPGAGATFRVALPLPAER